MTDTILVIDLNADLSDICGEIVSKKLTFLIEEGDFHLSSLIGFALLPNMHVVFNYFNFICIAYALSAPTLLGCADYFCLFSNNECLTFSAQIADGTFSAISAELILVLCSLDICVSFSSACFTCDNSQNEKLLPLFRDWLGTQVSTKLAISKWIITLHCLAFCSLFLILSPVADMKVMCQLSVVH